MATGMSKPVGFSNSSAGPPPGDFDTRSVTAAISRSGLTGSATRASSRSLSSAPMKSLRSLYISAAWSKDPATSHGLHAVEDRLRQLQGTQSIFPRNQWRALVAHGAHEVGQLALQGLFPRHGQLAALNLRALPLAPQQPVALDVLLGIVDRDVSVGLEEADLADALLADPARGDVRDAAGGKAQARVCDVVLVGEHRNADRFDGHRLRLDERQDDVEVVDHQVEHDVDVEAAVGKHAESVHLDEPRRRHERHDGGDGRV